MQWPKITWIWCSWTQFTKSLWVHNPNQVKINPALTRNIMIPSGENFAHVMTAQLSWHVQNYDLIRSLESKSEHKEFFKISVMSSYQLFTTLVPEVNITAASCPYIILIFGHMVHAWHQLRGSGIARYYIMLKIPETHWPIMYFNIMFLNYFSQGSMS